MTIELKGGTFTPIEPFSDSLLGKFKDLAEEGAAVALHIGSRSFLKRRINRKSLESRIDALEAKIEEQTPAQSTILHIPTKDEIKKVMEALP